MLQESVICQGGKSCVSKLHFCSMVERGAPSERMRELVKDAVYICKNCGRTANDQRYLCRPAMIE